METKTTVKKKKKKKKIIAYFKSYLILRTSLSFPRALVDWAGAAAEDAGPLPLDSSLVGMGKIAKTSSWLWETTPPSEESLGVARGFVASGVTSVVFSFSFATAPTCFAPFGGLLGGGRSWAGISWMEPGSWGQHHSKRLRSLVCGL